MTGWYQEESKKSKLKMENHKDPAEMNTGRIMAYHNEAWTCLTPFYMEEWTPRNMYRIM
jgi:hypothetical protein